MSHPPGAQVPRSSARQPMPLGLLLVVALLLAVSGGCDPQQAEPMFGGNRSQAPPTQTFAPNTDGGEALIGSWNVQQQFHPEDVEQAANSLESEEARQQFLDDIRGWEQDQLQMDFAADGTWQSASGGETEGDQGLWRVTSSSDEEFVVQLYSSRDESIETLTIRPQSNGQLVGLPTEELVESLGLGFQLIFNPIEGED